jgi:VWFA-related protein
VNNVPCALCVCALALLAGSQAQQPVFRSGVDGVTIQVSVTQRNHPVAGLAAPDFALLDNGVPQTVTTIEAQQIPLDLTLLLDLSTSVDGVQLQRLKTAVRDTAAALKPNDRIRLVVMSQVLHEVFSLRSPAASIPLDTLAAQGGTSLYDGIASALMRPSDIGRRQLIVALTDGVDSSSILAGADVTDIARFSDAVIDLVVPIAGDDDAGTRRLAQRSSLDTLAGGNLVGGRGTTSSAADDRVLPELAGLAAVTGGQVIRPDQHESVSKTFASILGTFRAGYVLQYVPRGVVPDGWHDVTVTVTKRGHYGVLSRRGYRGRGTLPQPVAKETR